MKDKYIRDYEKGITDGMRNTGLNKDTEAYYHGYLEGEGLRIEVREEFGVIVVDQRG